MRTNGDTIRVLIADDSSDVRADLRALLDLLDGVQVIGEVAAASDVLKATYDTQPDIVILDLDLGRSSSSELDGLEAIRELKRKRPQTTILVLTVHAYPAARQAALRAGADAFYVKGQDTNSLLAAVEVTRMHPAGTKP